MRTLEYLIRPTPKSIDFVKHSIKERLNVMDVNLLHQIEMVVSELLENSVKYCPPENNNQDIKLQFINDNKTVKIIVTNNIKSTDDKKNIEETIGKIQNSPESNNLYLERIREILYQKEHGKSQMGLYRIVYEGEFEITYSIDDDKLSITAVKNLI
ncbi:MAG: ATP-binding protein [Spirochaetes bacterium]|nr:ATP-binding protein [Spirochaetota bacterium]